MNITLWGTRGSVPVSGAPFVRHGGCTTCVSIAFEPTTQSQPSPLVIIDAGTGIAELGKNFVGPWGDTILLQTHLHWDHVQGFPFFGALFNPAAALDLWAVRRDDKTLREVLERQMSRPTFPVGLDIVPAKLTFRDLAPAGAESLRGGSTIEWAEMCHPSGSSAYRIEHRGNAFVFSGDVEVATGSRDALIRLARGADVLVMDAQYFPDEYTTRVGWGHSTPADAVDVALAAGVSRLIMTHHDPSHDDTRLEQKLQLARDLARGTGLVVDNAYDRMTIRLDDTLARAAA